MARAMASRFSCSVRTASSRGVSIFGTTTRRLSRVVVPRYRSRDASRAFDHHQAGRGRALFLEHVSHSNSEALLARESVGDDDGDANFVAALEVGGETFHAAAPFEPRHRRRKADVHEVAFGVALRQRDDEVGLVAAPKARDRAAAVVAEAALERERRARLRPPVLTSARDLDDAHAFLHLDDLD